MRVSLYSVPLGDMGRCSLCSAGRRKGHLKECHPRCACRTYICWK